MDVSILDMNTLIIKGGIMVDKKLKSVITDLCGDYEKAKQLYDSAGLNDELKQSALQSMATILQLQAVAISNYANFMATPNPRSN